MIATAIAMPTNRTGLLRAGLAALSVGLLTAGTLGTVAAVVIGTSAHLLGMPDQWAAGIAVAAAAGSLVPCAAFARRVWQVERRDLDG